MEDHYKGFTDATKLGEVARFQDSLNLLNEVFLFHPEGAIAYKYYYMALVECNLEDRIRQLERAREGFLFLFRSVNKNMDLPGMSEVHDRMLDHYKGLEGSRRSTMEEYDRHNECGLVDFSQISLVVED